MKIDLRYGPLFRPIRKIAKYILAYLYYIVVFLFEMPKVKSIDETLDKILEGGYSICRYGDGDFQTMIEKIDLPYQKYDNQLAKRMKEILLSDDPKILVGLPVGYYSIDGLVRESSLNWRSQIALVYPILKRYLDLNKQYYNSSMSRFYYEYQDKNVSKRYLNKLFKIWEGKNILLIEGEKSRLGMGNDLFNKALNVERILAPKHNAFSKYDQILSEALKHKKSKLILIALGSTATVLAFDLAKAGYQSIDIGNIDIEYEWYLRGAIKKIKIPGKYTSEASGGRIVDDVIDEKYASQIIAKIL
jgi:glycosyltransferase family protein